MLILAGAPIGRASDVGPRLAEVLATADVIAAEDTRRFARLASDLGIVVDAAVVSYFAGNEARRTPELVATLVQGQTVVLVTDAGMPSVSDPGYALVAAAIEQGIDVTAIPGPSAVTTALAVSGLPADRFCFEGFVPRKGAERRKAFTALAAEVRTMVFFESPRRTAACIDDMIEVFGPQRSVAVCRELTKTYEQVVRGSLRDIQTWIAEQEHGVRGEITIVLGGAVAAVVDYTADQLRALVDAAQSEHVSRKDAISQVSTQTGVRRRTVFEAAHQPH